MTFFPSIVSGTVTEVTPSPGMAFVILTLLFATTEYFICVAEAEAETFKPFLIHTAVTFLPSIVSGIVTDV